MVRKRQSNRRRPDRREQLRGAAASSWALIRAALPFAFLAVVALGLPYLTFQAYVHTVSSSYFALKHVEVRGHDRVGQDQILAAAQIVVGMNVFSVDTSRSEAVISGLDFVKAVRVERRLPDRVEVRIEEYVPAALLVEDGYTVIDAEGKGFLKLAAGAPLGALIDLPLISGLTRADLASERSVVLLGHALEVARIYDEMGLGQLQKLSQVHVDAVMGVSLVTEETGTEVRLGWGRYGERLERLRVVQSTLIRRGMDADYVLVDQDGDLGRVAVGRRPEPGSGDGGGVRATP
ncbi:MAG: FtsQ-type POTRA domain-containing protein [Bradymonadaceae bacterium]|nr:FtsQ-type POTRA domain-containing protein [Lujinxingiaceae bacterium]